MGATSRERYAVVSCHVERPLDDVVWERFSALQDARPGPLVVSPACGINSEHSIAALHGWVREALA